MTEPDPSNEPVDWWRLGCLVEGGLFGLAWLLSFVFGVALFEQYRWSWRELGIGLAAVIPMLGMFRECLRSEIEALREIREFLDQHLRPMFGKMSIGQIALLAGLAGVGEEALFRGVIQKSLEEPVGLFAAMLIANILFALAHSMTKGYFLLTLLIGFFLSGIYSHTQGLLAPTITHGVYDFIALVWFMRQKKDVHQTANGNETGSE